LGGELFPSLFLLSIAPLGIVQIFS
jgi:hypothetical protein